MDMEENLSLQNQLKATWITINSLKDKVNNYGNEIIRLHGRTTLAEACMGAMETHHCHAESKGYKAGFEDCKLLVVQILSKDGAHLLQVPIMTQAIRSLHVSQVNQE